jgi:hypothetical protein
MVLKEEIALLGNKNKLLFLVSCVMAIIDDFGSLLTVRTKLLCPHISFRASHCKFFCNRDQIVFQ